MKSQDRLAIVAFALARTGFCAYRAATQSLTHDEAFSYNNYIGGGWNRIYPFAYDANHHVLYSILAKLSVHVFRTSEFTVRLPSVVAGFFLVAGIYYVLVDAVSSRAVRWTTLIALSLHPLLLDFSVAARGYGLSLALLVWAIHAFLRNHDLLAGILLGLSISANVTMVVPAAGLVLCPFLLRSGDSEKRIQSCLTIAFAATGVALAICYEPMRKVSANNFYVGTPGLLDSVLNLVYSSFRSSLTRAGLFGTPQAASYVQRFLLPVIAIFVWGRLLAYGRLAPRLAPLVMLSTSILGLLAGHYAIGLNYPIDRLGMYLVLLFGISWAIAVSAGKSALVRWANAALAALLIVQFATQLHTRYFLLWKSDVALKQIARLLVDETSKPADKPPPNSVNVSATWYLQPTLEFYRTYYRIAALQPVKRTEPTPLEGFDFYVLDTAGDKTIAPDAVQRLIPLYKDPVSEVLLAKAR
ncbi:MAG: glycosyltransferase family 39 protein [Bryobacterales bacterium]|nr:glycosyltransferase family 39 protein [Bryobacterales bacterium]